MAVGILMLAAGSSRRFGSDKRQAMLAAGQTLLGAALANSSTSGLPLHVCLGHSDNELADSLRGQGYDVQLCRHSGLGMGATLAEGAAQLGDWEGVLVALGDMAWIAPDTFRLIAQGINSDSICAPYYKGQRGHPVGFGRDYYTELTELEGDRGAGALLEAFKLRVQRVDVSDSGILRDADTPADLPPIDH